MWLNSEKLYFFGSTKSEKKNLNIKMDRGAEDKDEESIYRTIHLILI